MSLIEDNIDNILLNMIKNTQYSEQLKLIHINDHNINKFLITNVKISQFNIINTINEVKEKSDEYNLFIQQLNCINNKPLEGIAVKIAEIFEMKRTKIRGLFKLLNDITSDEFKEIMNIFIVNNITNSDQLFNYMITNNIVNSNEQIEDLKIKISSLSDITNFISSINENTEQLHKYMFLLYLFTQYTDTPGDVLIDEEQSNNKCILYNFQSQLFPGMTHKIALTPLRIILLFLDEKIKRKLELTNEVLKQYFNQYDEQLLINTFETESVRLNWFRECIIKFLIHINDLIESTEKITLNIPLFIGCGMAGGNQSDYSKVLLTLCFLLYLYCGNRININLYYYNETEYDGKTISNNMNFFDYLNAPKIVRS
jgi:hypothetical protein